MLPETPQLMFDLMVNHLRQQNAVSTDEDGEACYYRSPTCLKCPVGAIIPDELYGPWMEGHRVIGLSKSAYIDRYLGLLLRKNLPLLVDFQFIHDTVQITSWEEYFRYAAAKHGLLLDEKEVAIPLSDNPLVSDVLKGRAKLVD